MGYGKRPPQLSKIGSKLHATVEAAAQGSRITGMKARAKTQRRVPAGSTRGGQFKGK